MFPKPIPDQPGFLDILLHAGTFPPPLNIHAGPLAVSIGCVPIAGTVGTKDPARWQHVIWFEGRAFTAILLCDVSGYHPLPFEALKAHLEQYPHMWTEIGKAA